MILVTKIYKKRRQQRGNQRWKQTSVASLFSFYFSFYHTSRTYEIYRGLLPWPTIAVNIPRKGGSPCLRPTEEAMNHSRHNSIKDEHNRQGQHVRLFPPTREMNRERGAKGSFVFHQRPRKTPAQSPRVNIWAAVQAPLVEGKGPFECMIAFLTRWMGGFEVAHTKSPFISVCFLSLLPFCGGVVFHFVTRRVPTWEIASESLRFPKYFKPVYRNACRCVFVVSKK